LFDEYKRQSIQWRNCMTTSRKLALLGLLTLATTFAADSALAVYVFQDIDYEVVNGALARGGTFTQSWGINDTGAIAMEIADGVTPVNFIYQPSTATFTRLAAPPAGLLASAIGINNAGVVVGSVYPSDFSSEYAFVLRDGAYQIFSQSGWNFTEARAVGSDGRVTGFSYSRIGSASTGVAFIYDPASAIFTPFGVPGAVATLAQGMNAAGQVVGSSYAFADDGGNFWGASAFLREANGDITPFRINGAATAARGINDNGLIAGWTNTSNGQRAFIGNASGFQLLECPADVCPGMTDMGAEGINNLGQVVGGWFENHSASIMHGFLATPVSMPTGMTVNGAYTFTVDVVRDITIFIDPKVAIGYDYAVGAADPLFATVRLPFGIGDNVYTVIAAGRSFSVSANEQFDFRSHGFPNGVAKFRVASIESDAALDPANPNAFPTGLTFTAAGRFTGSMTPLCRPAKMPDRANVPDGRALVACQSS
jgi:probable HAF family extracellular repeat protein